MPLLEVAAAQPNFQNHLDALRSQALTNVRFFPNSCSLGNCKTFSPIWKPLGIRKKMRIEIWPANFAIEAAATLELKCSDSREHVFLDDSQAGSESSPPGSLLGSSGRDDLAMDEREKLRRMRISKANKGNTPWNKGRKHSAETLQRIRERTRIAMQDPKVRMKLAKLGHAQTEEARLKIGVGVRMGWERRRQMLVVQEICYFEWQNLIAEASRRGYAGEDELRWDSYETLSEQLKREWIDSIEQRKAMPRPKTCRWAPKSLEQRRKIAEAIAAKWADPEYRDRVCSGLAKYHGTDAGGERKPRRSPSAITRPRRNSSPKKPREMGNALKRDSTGCIRQAKPRRSNGPLFRDPKARSKLEMIKSIRAQRTASETSTIEAINRARLLITEAERAARALEVAAAKSPIARASLIETWKLISEAIQSIESAETVSASSDATSVANFHEEDSRIESSIIELTGTRVNGTVAGVNAWKDEFDSGKFSLQQQLEASDSVSQQELLGMATFGRDERLPWPNGTEHASLTATSDTNSSSATVTLTKKWVRGRLVEVVANDEYDPKQ